MKKIFAMLTAGLLMAGVASAQQGPATERKPRHENQEGRKGDRERRSPEQLASRQTAVLDKQLGLSNKQRRKVEEISLKRAQETEALRSRFAEARQQQQGRGRKAGMHQEMRAINERWEAELKDILSKKQYSQYEASRQQMKSRRLAGEGARGERDGRRKEIRRQSRENG